MIELVLSLPKWVGIVTSMVLAAAVGLVVYFVSYKLVSQYRIDELKDPTGNIIKLVSKEMVENLQKNKLLRKTH